MYRRLESSLPKDFVFPADLKGLGYFINEKDQIRMIDDPNQDFHYFISKNQRYVEMQKEAMSECIRRIVSDRLHALSLQTTPLPIGTPTDMPHVPIFASTNLATAKRIIVYVGEMSQDLGIFAGRIISHESVSSGSAVEFVSTIQRSNRENDIGIVITNPGQLLWYRRGRKTMSYQSWHAIPRKWAVSEAPRMTAKNRIPRNGDQHEHLACVFEDLLAAPIARGAKLDIVAIGDGIEVLIQYLQSNWEKWGESIEAVAAGSSYVYQPEFNDMGFKEFWGKRARAYIVDSEPLGTPLTGRQRFGCNVFSSGSSDFAECIMTRAHRAILDYFKLVSMMPDYENAPQDIPEPEFEKLSDDWGEEAKGGNKGDGEGLDLEEAKEEANKVVEAEVAEEQGQTRKEEEALHSEAEEHWTANARERPVFGP